VDVFGEMARMYEPLHIDYTLRLITDAMWFAPFLRCTRRAGGSIREARI
jgi:hypothetical protein